MTDRPLLALSGAGRGRGGGQGSPDAAAATATDNMRQLIRLRWLAVGGQFVTILAVRYGLGVRLPVAALLAVVGLLALANLLGAVLLPRHRVRPTEFLLALLFDVGVLTVQLYLSGGAQNPFIALYLLQVVLGAILLRGALMWMLVPVTIGCYALLATQSRPLLFPPNLAGHVVALTTLGNWLGFALVTTLLVPFIARISRNLRSRDAFLAELRRQAAEEDNIVRMGLFASGAAHELGTPLGTLSVILSDWQRMPALAGDPELSGELEEMQAEVRRCKSIVTDILHSAGQPRPEVMGRTDAAGFVDAVAEAWQVAHPAVTFDARTEPLRGAAILAEPALRQAVWNLLENAAEASPHRVGLRAALEGGMLVVAVRDRGPGFPASVLRQFGQPCQSGKGAGHGIGLFLVASVARRLGGRAEAANLPGGGAEVRLTIPVASG